MPLRLLCLMLIACGGKSEDTALASSTTATATGSTTGQDCDITVDADCDGVTDDADCDPNDASVYPGADDIPYDGLDNDCAGDGDLVDVDGDGYVGTGADGDDCNDSNPEIYPGAPEICYNGIDEDCAGDEDTDDCDGDGHPGYGTDATDCDDEDPAINPDAEEIWYDGLDQDCAGPYASDYDADGDEEDSATQTKDGTDCDDFDALTGAEKPERWDGVDRNCDGDVDVMSGDDVVASYYPNPKDGDYWFGRVVVALDDYDGDGLREFGVGGPLSGTDSDNPEGYFQVLGGGEADGRPAELRLGLIEGSRANYLGMDAAVPGDLNGDGWVELAVGAPTRTVGADAGAVLLFDGADLQGGDVAVTAALAVMAGNTYVGMDVAPAGDIDGDGVGDVVAGSGSGDFGMSLWVAVYGGADLLSASDTLTASDSLGIVEAGGVGGETVGGADFDGDGVDDLFVAWDTDGAGSVALISGAALSPGTIMSAQDFPTLVGARGERLGLNSAISDDADGDGSPDLVTSAPGADTAAEDEGLVRVITDPGAGGAVNALAHFSVEGTIAYGMLSTSTEACGDHDADGVDDLIVSHVGGSALAYIETTVHGFSGTTVRAGGTVSATDGDVVFTTRIKNDAYGWGALAWDRDGDGDDDLALGAYLQNNLGMLEVFDPDL